MKRPFLGILVLGIFLLFMSLSIIAQAQSPVFRIGVLDDEDGAISNGARLAVQEINSTGGVRGADGTFFQLELISEPVSDGTTVAEAANTLSQSSVIAILGPENSDDVLNNLQVLQNLSVPVITPATSDTILTSDSTGRIFRSRAAEVLQGRALANYLINDLQIQSIAAVQLDQDINTAASLIGFSTAASALGRPPLPVLQAQSNESLPQIVNQISLSNSEIVAVYGDPASAKQLYESLRADGWEGFFAYNQADEPSFRNALSQEAQSGIISTTTWPFNATDEGSSRFRDSYISLYGELPGSVEAATYDSVYLLAQAIGLPGELQTNLRQLDNVSGVQGLLTPMQLSHGETSENVAVIRLGAFGGIEILARFRGNTRVDINEPIGPIPTAVPEATPTPQGVVATITRAVQNVRSGPSTSYPIIGQLSLGEQVQIIGANLDFTWLVIQFRGQQGWLSTSILDVFGDLNSLPIITPPATPTPAPTATPPPAPDIVIDSASGAPSPFIVNQPFTVSVSVRNAGGAPSAQFAIAATFPPNDVFASVIVPPLGAGQSILVNLSNTFTNTGFYAVVIVADLNNDVVEGNETNNFFNFSYGINKPILRQGSQALNPGDAIDLEGNGVLFDVNWDGSQLNTLSTARIGVIPNVTVSTVHWDLINPSVVNGTTIPNGSLIPGTIVGIITADGNRGVIRVDNLSGQLAVTFIVYQN
jgi:ABC-type branched-subunit amino acid transport system substrate-binding protein